MNAIRKRSVVVAGRKTSVSIEDAFWSSVRSISAERRIPVKTLIEEIDRSRAGGNLSSSIRLAVLFHYQDRAAAGARR